MLKKEVIRMRTANMHYREKFGCKVYRLSLDGGFTCPNRDGTVGTGGCIFCSAAGGGEFAERTGSVAEQLERAKLRVAAKNRNGKYMAYFQSFTGTYAPAEYLEELYLQAIAPAEIVGLTVGTRPDCLGQDVMALLKRINKIKPVAVELGLQTVHDSTARFIRRGYPAEVYFDAVNRLKEAGIEVITHIILGLPGETPEMMEQTVRRVAEAGTDGVKFHLLHVLRGTDLEKEYEAGRVRCLTMEEYGSILKRCVDILPETITVHRITGDGAKRDLVAPLWTGDKKRVLNYLNRILSGQSETPDL